MITHSKEHAHSKREKKEEGERTLGRGERERG